MSFFAINTHQAVLFVANLGRGRGVGQFGRGERFLDVAPCDASGVEILDFVVCWFHELQLTCRLRLTQAMRRSYSVIMAIFQIAEGGSSPTAAHQSHTGDINGVIKQVAVRAACFHLRGLSWAN